jgi:predicted DNA-binding transcriptional regulator AlpA
MNSVSNSYEVLTSGELAARLKVKESWIIDRSKRSKTADPIPVLRLGKHRRYRWDSPEMIAWLERRAGNTTRRAEPSKGGNI